MNKLKLISIIQNLFVFKYSSISFAQMNFTHNTYYYYYQVPTGIGNGSVMHMM
ncbi:hypothetical protein [Marivirga sp.]|uniref:hypothetical protein n=1 Tax=Marivirga sp. TaxID=2018662 RepID=UPI0025F0F8EA|nr:hypothetical protein [Marivirga sp.]